MNPSLILAAIANRVANRESYQRASHAALLLILALSLGIPFLSGCGDTTPEEVAKDEAMLRAQEEGLTPQQAAYQYFYPKQIDDYFKGMDTIVTGLPKPDPLIDSSEMKDADVSAVAARPDPVVPQLTKNEVLGRNTWMIWCGGNEGFWDWLATDSLGFIDLVKLVDSRQFDQRFTKSGLINEPGYDKSAAPAEFGLWLDLPQDPLIRQWRREYVERTFAEIAAGTHKSQRGLPVGIDDKSDSDGGAKYEGYLYPSQYLPANRRSGEYRYPPYDNYEKDDPTKMNPYDERIPPPDIYGLSSGVIGLRLFPNPYFDKAAQASWKSEKYYSDPDYFNDPKLVRPYRMGMSCAFCHASFHPLNPPPDTTRPEWENISGNIGAQYLSMRATVGNLLEKNEFVYHLLESQPRGTIDTSLIASDNINNANTMNAVFNIPQRVLLSLRNPAEDISVASSRLPSVWAHPNMTAGPGVDDGVPEDWQKVFAQQELSEELRDSNSDPRMTTRVLLDGSDAIGPWGALARVYLNIGSYYERWNQVHQPVLGFTKQKRFTIHDCQNNSVYWNATALRVGPLRDYFLKVTPPMPLLSTKDGLKRTEPIDMMAIAAKTALRTEQEKLLAIEKAQHIDTSKLAHGRKVFARNCIVCHSSIQPESSAETLFAEEDQRQAYREKHEALIAKRKFLRAQWAEDGEFWDHDPGQWLRDEAYQKWAEDIVERAPFWEWNFLSSDYRVPITIVKTNSARAMATNAMEDHVWHDFASDSYRKLKSPGTIDYFNPYKGKDGDWDSYTPRHQVAPGVPEGGGGPGYYRPASLVSVWATAPLLHNNSLGLYNNDPSVEGRLEAFDDAIRKLLWPKKRLEHSSYNDATPERLQRDHGLIWRTSEESYLTIQSKTVPHLTQRLPIVSRLKMRFPWLQSVYPIGLPSLILIAAAFLILSLHDNKLRRLFGLALILFAIVFAVLMWVANRYPDIRLLTWFRVIEPWWLTVGILLVAGFVMLWPFTRRFTRWLGYSSIILGLLLGMILYFNAGRLGDLDIGPIPKGTPVNLLANFNSEADPKKLKRAIKTTVGGLAEIQSRHLDEKDTQALMRETIAPALMEVNKCPDFVMDRGHYFEWFDAMTDDDKDSVIELLKTF